MLLQLIPRECNHDRAPASQTSWTRNGDLRCAFDWLEEWHRGSAQIELIELNKICDTELAGICVSHLNDDWRIEAKPPARRRHGCSPNIGSSSVHSSVLLLPSLYLFSSSRLLLGRLRSDDDGMRLLHHRLDGPLFKFFLDMEKA